MSACVFCRNEILNNQFYESENFRVIYNLAPILPGHTLIVPKTHYTTFLELSRELREELINLSHKIAKNLMNIFKSSGFDFTLQDGECAGQTVLHLHLHLIPRSVGDLAYPGEWYPKMKGSFPFVHTDMCERTQLNTKEMNEIVIYLREVFKDLSD